MRRILTVIVILLLFLFAATQSHHLISFRRKGLPDAYTGFSADTPPALSFVIAGLGGFRGIVSEVLWFRVSRLQEEGRYLELVQLADWIARLDPHASEAWVYNAWNLAYNVSVMMIRSEDRLRWVQNGVALLRDDALRFNPREARLYRELAWLYQNKIGDSLDSAHLTYKIALAESMSSLVNPDGSVCTTPESRVRLGKLKLDADRMSILEHRFGPLDWRLAESHAIYWAYQGLEYATGAERLMSRRGVYQPLILSVVRGRFTGDLTIKQWQTAPNLPLADATADFIAETLKEFPSKTLTNVYINYLLISIQMFNKSRDTQSANAFYRRLLLVLPQGQPYPKLDDVLNGWRLKDE